MSLPSFWRLRCSIRGRPSPLGKLCREQVPDRDPAFSLVTFWRELAPRPANKPAARAVLLAVADERIERLEQIVAEFQEITEAEAAERPDRAAFDPSPSFERHRRPQSSLGRELLRTIDTLRRLRKAEVCPYGHDSPSLPHGQSSGPCRPDVDTEAHTMETDTAPRCPREGQGPLPGASASTPPTQPPGERECQGLHAGSSASTPPTQPPQEVDAISVECDVHDHESATIEANNTCRALQTIIYIISTFVRYDEGDRTQSPGQPARPLG